MRFNFKKIASVLASAVMIGSTAGVALAANYPMPMVSSGTADGAVVVTSGTHAGAVSDWDAAVDVQTALQGHVTSGGTGTTDVTTGDIVSLDTSSTRIWLNTSLNTAKTVLTKTDLPNVLGDYTFSGNVDSKLTSTIKFGTGNVAGADNSGKVIFAKQPKSSNDPTIGISLGSDQGASYLYNASITMKAINFSNADSTSETIKLFGREFVISTATVPGGDDLILFSSSEEVTLTAGGADANPSITTTVGDTEYTVELVSGSDTTATIEVNGESKEITEGNSKKIAGLEVAIKSVDESEALGTVTASLLVGSEKITLTHNSQVTLGSDDDPVDGTYVFMSGTTTRRVEDMTEMRVTIFRPTSSDDAINAGESFTDPVFGSFKVDFVGISSSLDDAARETITIENSGDKAMSLTMTDSDGNEGTFEFAYNASQQFFLGDDGNYTIHVREMANVSENDFVMLGNEDYGHLLELTQIYNNTGTDQTKDKVTLQDVISGTSYSSTFTSEGSGTLSVDGKSYAVTFRGSGDDGRVQFKYPTGDSANANTMVAYPTIQTKNGAKVALVYPITFNGTQFDNAFGNQNHLATIRVPDGDGYADITYAGGGDAQHVAVNLTYSGTTSVMNCSGDGTNPDAEVIVGDITYGFECLTNITNMTRMWIARVDMTAGGAEITQNVSQRPGVLVWEEKDDASEYKAIYVDLESNPAGSSTDGVGVDDVHFSSDTKWSSTLQSDTDVEKELDWWGTLVTSDSSTSSQKTVTINYPDEQVYSQIYVGELESSVTPGTTGGSGGTILVVKDSEVASVSNKNLVVVGGSCINRAAAEILGVTYPTCAEDFTAATNVGAGQYLVKAAASPYNAEKTAVLVAGYEAEQTKLAVAKLKESHATDVGTENIYPVTTA